MAAFTIVNAGCKSSHCGAGGGIGGSARGELQCLFKHVLFASSAAFSLIAPVTQAWAQYRYDDRPALNRPTQQRPVHVTQPKQAVRPQPALRISRSRRSRLSATCRTIAAKPAPAVPLTDEQIAAKAAVDERCWRASLRSMRPRTFPIRRSPGQPPQGTMRKSGSWRRSRPSRRPRPPGGASWKQRTRRARRPRRRRLKAKHDAQAKNVKLKVEPRVEPTKSKQVACDRFRPACAPRAGPARASHAGAGRATVGAQPVAIRELRQRC